MNAMDFKADRPTLVVGCTLLAVALLVLYGVVHFWLLRQGFVGEIDAIQPRTARLLGITQSLPELEVAAEAAGAGLRDLAYSSDSDSAATAAAMQQDVRELLTNAGMSVSGSQVLPPRALEGFDRLGLDITAVGNIDAVDEALAGLELVRPQIFIDSVKLKPERSRSRSRSSRNQPETPEPGDPRKVSVQLELFSLRLRED